MIPKKILIVCGETIAVNVMNKALADTGHEVFCAFSADQALQMAGERGVDLVIVDMMLQGMNGMEIFENMRTDNPGLLGILVAEQTSVDMVIKAMAKGFSNILENNAGSAVILKVVQDAISLADLRTENTRLKAMLPLYRMGPKFVAAESSEEVYELLLEAVSIQIGVPNISLMMFVEKDKSLRIVASRGIDENVAKNVTIKSGERIAGWVYAHGEPVILNKLTQNQSPLAKYLQRHEIKASISFPLLGREKILGVLNISRTDSEVEFNQSDIELLSIICGQAVMGLEIVHSMLEREQNARTKALFEQYVAPEVAEILLDSGHDLMSIGEVRELTVLFADIRNFTIAVQHLSHSEIHDFLTGFFDLFAEVAFSWKGTLDKFMGDAALVAFGAPVSLDDPSDAAVCTAIELSQRFEQLRQQWLYKSEVFNKLGLGIGISRGELFHGNVGSSRRLDYTVIGTDVNIAQRLASVSDSGQILLTEAVKNDVKRSYPLQREAVRELRGVERKVQLYSLMAQEVKLF